MANFAKEQLMKYGWTEGKGLGKNENGITKPVKLATSQNKAGVGYDEYETPWWEKMYNDASKNVKVESQGDQVSLTVVNDTRATQTRKNELSNSFTKATNFQVAPAWQTDSMLDNNYLKVGAMCAADQKSHVTRDGASELVLTSNEKSKKIVEYNSRAHSNAQVNVAGKNAIAYRITNVESDVEESSEHDVDGNASIPQAFQEEQFSLDRSMKRKHHRKIKSLVNQLSTCNLEENNIKRVIHFPNHNLYKKIRCKELSQKMKKGKEETVNSSILIQFIKQKKIDQVNKRMEHLGNELMKMYQMKGIKLCEKPDAHLSSSLQVFEIAKRKVLTEEQQENIEEKLTKLKNLSYKELELGKYGSQKDSIDQYYNTKPELRPTEFNEPTTKPDWIQIDIGHEIPEKNYVHYTTTVIPVHNRQQSIQKKMARNYAKYSYDPSTKAIINKQTKMKYPKIHTKIQKKNNKQFKCNIKKNFEHCLKVKPFAHELNMDSVIKDLAECGLAEKVNIIKKRSTQTHLTPV